MTGPHGSPMGGDTKNYILFIALSLLIFLGWQQFYAKPELERQRAVQMAEQKKKKAADSADTTVPQVQSGADTGSAPVPGTATAGAIRPRETVIAATPRVKIETHSLSGSINLQGAQIDDLKLLKYRERVELDSPSITLLSPVGADKAFYAEQGWVSDPATKVKLPSPTTVWKASPGAKLRHNSPVTLTWDNGEGLTFERTFEVDDQYMFTVTQRVRNAGTSPVVLFPYSRIQRYGIPENLTGIYVLHEGMIGVFGEGHEEIDYSDLKDDPRKIRHEAAGGWAGITDKYWAVTLIPDQTTVNAGRFFYRAAGDQDVFQSDYLAQTGLTVGPGATQKVTSRVFAGAKVVNTINAYRDSLKIDRFDLMIDWGWFYFLTKPLFWVMDKIQSMVGNFGLSILIVTVLVKIAFFPLANKSYKSMAQMKMLQPEMMKLRERFPDDKVRQQQEMMALYKKEKVTPLSGCLPVLVQIPVFFALYKVIYVTIELRHAPFYGWIKDLSAPDPTSIFNLFGLLPFEVPQFLLIGVLPLLMGITMWIQMRLNPAPPDPVQAQIFMWMPVLFTVLLASFPAGLVLYWAWNNFLSILQQYTIMKRQGADVNLIQNIKDSLPFLKANRAE